MSEMNYADWLNAQFTIHKNKSKTDLALALGLEPPAISKILNGTRQVKAREYVIMRHFFGLPSGASPTARHATDNSAEQVSFNDSQDGDGDWLIPKDVKSEYTDHALANYTVHDNYMQPEFENGNSVLVNTVDTIPSPAGIFVVSDKFSHMVRHCEIVTDSSPVEIRITAIDPSFQAQTLKIDDFEIIGRVSAKVTWLKNAD